MSVSKQSTRGSFQLLEAEKTKGAGGGVVWFDIQLRHNIATGETQMADLSSLQDLASTQAPANAQTAVSTPQSKAAQRSITTQTDGMPTCDTHSQTHPVLGLPPLVATDTYRMGMDVGREASVTNRECR